MTLSNQAGSTDYILDLIVSPDENANSAPYFDADEWKDAQLTVVTQGDQQVYQLPQAYDDEFDEVTVTVDTSSIFQFASWDAPSETLSLYPSSQVKSKLYRAKVTLDDGQLTTNYTLSILVEPSVVDEPEEESGNQTANINQTTTTNQTTDTNSTDGGDQ